MIKKLHVFVFKAFVGPLILTFFIAEFVLIMQFLLVFIEDLVGKGLEWNIIFELFVSASAGLVNLALPLAILLASVMTFGTLGENYELGMKTRSIRYMYSSLFGKDIAHFKLLVDEYNKLYNILAIKYRDSIFLKANLEKFPKIELESTQETKVQVIAKYFTATIFFLPLGLLRVVINYIEYHILKQKLNLIIQQMHCFI
jgi:hypothetical protein